MILADFWSENAVAIILGVISSFGGLVAWLTKIARQMTRLEAGQEFIIENMKRMGNDSTTSRDSVREELERVKTQVHGLEITLAGMHGAKPNGAGV
jgi:predicted negative regulator of RcsB-dependent stress response